jgi:eukaryotic-like serine/threonine-protein kinase
MALVAGARVGPYEILAAIGAGGMGEVYRARDTRLKRDVAIKVLPDAFAHDPDRLARFQREAELLATLNHPNIAAVYGLEQIDGLAGIVLELVEGHTLAEVIARGPIAVGDALPIAFQIADALEAAHERGVIHRDLKPANIKLRPDGTVKVLDFGLAKALEPASISGDVSQSPTLTSPAAMTRMGVILGTAAYMSPEQAKGRQAEKRSDVWAFGCVLYEMLTGKRAFEGEDVSDTLASVLRSEPDWNALPASSSPHTSLLKRCLEKDGKRRLRDIGDVKLLLEDAGMAPATASRVVSAKRSWWIAAAAALGLMLGGTFGALLAPARRGTLPTRVARFELRSSPADPFTTDPGGVNLAISPDGSRIVYTAKRGDTSQLVMRRLDRLDTTPIAGTEEAFEPFFSPDGQHIAFRTRGELKKVAVEGGPSVAICRLGIGQIGASWGPDDSIVFAQGNGRGLFRVPASGGQPQKLAAPDATKGEANYFVPSMLPTGQALLYTVVLHDGQTRIMVRSLQGGHETPVVEGGFGGRYLPSGHIAYGQGDRLMAVPFDVTVLRTTGSPVSVQDGVFTKIDQNVLNAVSAADGTTTYVSGRNAGVGGRPVWVDRRGVRVARVVEQPLEEPRYPRLSPDGGRLALTVGPFARGNVWIYDLNRAAQPLKLTFQGHNIFPIWSPDGKRIVFLSPSGSSNHMLSIPSDGSGTDPERLTTSESVKVPLAWSPDGALVLFTETASRTRSDLWLLQMSDRTTRPWLQTPLDETDGRFSPDGHWIAYVSDQTGRPEVWVRPFPGPGAPVRVSPDGGRNPMWSRDGRELFYENGPKVLSTPVVTQESDLRVGTPRMLFEGGFVPGSARSFDVGPDGRFLMIEANDTATSASIVVVQNWFEELKRLAPGK